VYFPMELLSFICYAVHVLPWVPEAFFSLASGKIGWRPSCVGRRPIKRLAARRNLKARELWFTVLVELWSSFILLSSNQWQQMSPAVVTCNGMWRYDRSGLITCWFNEGVKWFALVFNGIRANKNNPGKSYCPHNLPAQVSCIAFKSPWSKGQSCYYCTWRVARAVFGLTFYILLIFSLRISALGFAKMKVYFPARAPSLLPSSPDKQVHEMPRRINLFIWHSVSPFSMQTTITIGLLG